MFKMLDVGVKDYERMFEHLAIRRLDRVMAWGSLALVGIALAVHAAEPEGGPLDRKSTCRSALAEFNSLIGGWRGVGQPVRNSTKGSWSETAEWIWEIKPDDVALKYTVEGGKVLRSARLTYDPDRQRYLCEAVLSDKSTRAYAGVLKDGKLFLESESDAAGQIHQLQVTRLNPQRTLVLFQTRGEGQQQPTRVAEVGYTRAGERLAVEGAGEPACIVTGGRGTLTSVYKGKTYYFCCTGCRDAFLDDPEGILAEAEKTKARQGKR